MAISSDIKDRVREGAVNAASCLGKGNITGTLAVLQTTYERLENTEDAMVYKRRMGRFAITARRAYGLQVPLIQLIAKKLIPVMKDQGLAKDFLDALWGAELYENKMLYGFCLEALAECPEYLEEVRLRLPDCENWAVCDTISTNGLYAILRKNSGAVLREFETWVRDSDIWVRRAVPASFAAYVIHEEEIDIRRLLSLLRPLMSDPEPYVKKGVSWALRNASKYHEEAIYEFLMEYTDTDNKDTKFIIRDSVKKLSEEHRQRIRADLKR